MSKENENQFNLPMEEERDDFPDEYGLDSHKASDFLPDVKQCGTIISQLLSINQQQPIVEIEKKEPQESRLDVQKVKSLEQERQKIVDIAERQISILRDKEYKKVLEQKEQAIKAETQKTKRAYDSLPHFYKIPMWKARPYRKKMINTFGKEVFEPITNDINFEGIEATALFSGGELGYQDRLVYIAVYNQAIRNKGFLQEYGKLFLSLNQIAEEAGIKKTDTGRKQKVRQSLERLQRTELYFTKGFGDFLTYSFNMLAGVGKRKIKEVKKELEKAKELNMLFCINDRKTNREVTQIEFSSEIIKVICESNQKTTVDMWALQQLNGVEQTLFLYLYDWVQVNKAETHTMTLKNLFELAGMELKTCKNKKGKTFIDWKTSLIFLKQKLEQVQGIAKFLKGFEVLGEKENIAITFSLDYQTRQIPKRFN